MLHCAAPALQQGHMLAQIAEEIHAPDRAAEDTGEGGNSDYQDLSLSMMQLLKSPLHDQCRWSRSFLVRTRVLVHVYWTLCVEIHLKCSSIM